MAKKEHKGGMLTNEEVERDNRARGKDAKGKPVYSGVQDTGDQKIRGKGSEVQKSDGLIDETNKRKIN
jgi:hypothetical protein